MVQFLQGLGGWHRRRQEKFNLTDFIFQFLDSGRPTRSHVFVRWGHLGRLLQASTRTRIAIINSFYKFIDSGPCRNTRFFVVKRTGPMVEFGEGIGGTLEASRKNDLS